MFRSATLALALVPALAAPSFSSEPAASTAVHAALPYRPALGEIVEHHDNGAVSRRAKTDREGRLHGECLDYYPDGTLAARAQYKKGVLNGAFASFHPDGRAWVEARYRSGELSGPWVEHRADGVRTVRGKYRKGLRDGTFEVRGPDGVLRELEYDEDRLVEIDGVETSSRTAAEVWATLDRIRDPNEHFGGAGLGKHDAVGKGEDEPEDAWVARGLEQDAALRRWMEFRYLAGVAWDDMVVSARFNHQASLGARLVRELGAYSTDPDNPGWDKPRFRQAKLGLMGANHVDAPTLLAALDQGIAQFGAGGVAFRTSLLDPKLRTVGFGRAGTSNLIWWDDASRTSPPEWDAICFPPAGPVPLDAFGATHRWSVELNPANHAALAFQNEVSIEVYVLDEDWVRTHGPLELEAVDFHDRTLAFRPVGITVTDGARFEVRLPGIRHDKVGSAFTYHVEFVARPDGPPAPKGLFAQ